MSKSAITLQDVYDVVNSTKQEMIDRIDRLETKFDTMEAGRLTTAERNIAQLTANMELIKKIVYGMAGLILTAVVGAIMFNILGKP